MEATPRLIANRTTFIIAHRHSTLRHCDLLLVLNEGRLVQVTERPQDVLRDLAFRPERRVDSAGACNSFSM